MEFKYKDTGKLKVKGCKKTYDATTTYKKRGMATFIRDKAKYFMMIKGSGHQGDIAILNVQALNDRATQYKKQGKRFLKNGVTYTYDTNYFTVYKVCLENIQQFLI